MFLIKLNFKNIGANSNIDSCQVELFVWKSNVDSEKWKSFVFTCHGLFDFSVNSFRYFYVFFLAYSSALKWYNLWCRFWNFLFDLFELILSNKIIFNERNGLETGDYKINLCVFCLSLQRRAYNDDVVSYFANFGRTYWRISVVSRLSCVYNLVIYYLTDFISY